MIPGLIRTPKAVALACATLVVVVGCESPVVAPTIDGAVRFARAGGGGGGPEVTGAMPAEGAQGTINLQVHLVGSGFDNGSNAIWLRDGSPAADVVTNSTTYVSDSELIADITIDAAALTTVYDIEVTTRRGKKGVGVELFSVKKPGEVAPGYTLSFFANPDAYVNDVSDSDVLAGSLGGEPALFDLAGNPTSLPTLAPNTGVRSISPHAAYAIGSDWDGIYEGSVIWSLASGPTVVRPEPLPGFPFADFENELNDVNDGGIVVGQVIARDLSDKHPVIWEPDGSGRWVPQVLPLLPGFDRGWALGINNNGDVVGRNRIDATFSSGRAVLWSKNTDGSYDVTDLTPLADGTGDNIAVVVGDRSPDGTISVVGRGTVASAGAATRWTVDALGRTLLEELRAPAPGSTSPDIGPDGEILLGAYVWDPATNLVSELLATGTNCSMSSGAFLSSGQIIGRSEVGTKNGSTCSLNGRWVEEVAVIWTKQGG